MMMEFKGNHVLSVNQFDRDSIQRVFDVADHMAPYAMREKRTTETFRVRVKFR
jgi:aspartate carbamoyltransferase catalytic subunit